MITIDVVPEATGLPHSGNHYTKFVFLPEEGFFRFLSSLLCYAALFQYRSGYCKWEGIRLTIYRLPYHHMQSWCTYITYVCNAWIHSCKHARRSKLSKTLEQISFHEFIIIFLSLFFSCWKMRMRKNVGGNFKLNTFL